MKLENRMRALPRRANTIGRELFSASEWDEITQSLGGLTSREFQIVQGVFDNKSDMEIGSELDISSHTVHEYLKRLFRKLGISGRIELVVCIVEAYIVLQSDVTRCGDTKAGD